MSVKIGYVSYPYKYFTYIIRIYLLYLLINKTDINPMRDSRLEIKLSSKLKDDFKAMCNDLEVDMSDKVREIIANLVRNHKRQTAKVGKEEE